MTVIAVQVKKKQIELASDCQTTWGSNKFPKKETTDSSIKVNGKIFQLNGMTVGAAGETSTISWLQIFCKSHKPKEADRDSILEWFVEFKQWVKIKGTLDNISIHFILIMNGKAFAVYDFMEVNEITDFDAVGSGMWLAIGAMDNGCSVTEAVNTAIKYDLYCGGKTNYVIVEI